MIISASYRIDIPAFYDEWFMHRLKHGYCKVIVLNDGNIVERGSIKESMQANGLFVKHVALTFEQMRLSNLAEEKRISNCKNIILC